MSSKMVEVRVMADAEESPGVIYWKARGIDLGEGEVYDDISN